MDLTAFPRVCFAHLPTPIEPLDRLSERLGGPRIWVKRDDCTGLATGGNKTRKLEFVVGAALEAGADTLVTTGALQSNHVRQTAAACARFGLQCEAVLQRAVPRSGPEYEEGGNVMLDRLFGARLHVVDKDADAETEMERVADGLRSAGRSPWIVPRGGSNPTGALGYALAAFEIEHQANAMGLSLDALVHASGSAGTQAGLVAGLVGNDNPLPVIGVSVARPRGMLHTMVHELAMETATVMGAVGGVVAERVEVDDTHVGDGYGVPTDGMVEAVRTVAETEGLLLDPVYTGKAVAGLIAMVRAGRFGKDDNVLFLHTGGSISLPAYRDAFA